MSKEDVIKEIRDVTTQLFKQQTEFCNKAKTIIDHSNSFIEHTIEVQKQNTETEKRMNELIEIIEK
tara:strand:+ start:203 stop:400 length:198 start_codon:yes stop_codon:yes gene_type:complete